MRRAARAAAHALCAALACAGTAELLRPVWPPPADGGLGAKLAHLRARAGEYDTLFLGSSRVLRHVVPHVFDARTAELGRATRSFNLGLAGAGHFETDALLREVLALEGARLRTVFVEPGDWRDGMAEENARSPRAVRWHTPRGTFLAVRSALAGDASLAQRLRRAALHLSLGVRRFAGAGEGRRVARELLGSGGPGDPDALTPEEVARGAGYQALEEARGDDARRRAEALRRDPGVLLERLARLPRENARRAGSSDLARDAVRAQAELARARGFELVHLAPPGSTPVAHELGMRARGELDVLLAFADPTEWPELLDPAGFFDLNHLGAPAARRFSRALADVFAAWSAGARAGRGIAPGPP